jgi:ferrous-iron efflux pump FieF
VAHDRARLTARAALASVAVAVTLLIAKLWAAIATDSTAMLGSLADTGLDVIASLVTLAGVRIAALPPITTTGSVTARPRLWWRSAKWC